MRDIVCFHKKAATLDEDVATETSLYLAEPFSVFVNDFQAKIE